MAIKTGYKISFFITALTLSVLLLSGDSIGENKKPVGSVVSWMNDVIIYPADNGKKRPVMSMEPLFVGDTVVTGTRSKAKLLMKDDSIISIAPQSRIVIKDYEFSEKGRKRVSLLKILSGKARGVVNRFFSKKNSIFEIETPTAVVGVKGTDFIISTNSTSTEVYTISGKVTAGNVNPAVGGSVTIKAGHFSKVAKGQLPEEPKKVSKNDIGKLLNLMDETSIPVTHPLEIKEEGCMGCHGQVFEKMKSVKFPHESAMKDCKVCHVKPVSTMSGRNMKVPMFTMHGIAKLNVNPDVSYNIAIELEDREGKKTLSRPVEFTAKKVKAKVSDSTAPIVVSDFELRELKGGVFYTAIFSWKTDRPTTTEVEYGPNARHTKRFSADRDFYTTDHMVEVTNLASGKKFVARVASKDAYGNPVYSEHIEFKSNKPFKGKPFADTGGNPTIKNVNVVKLDSGVAVMWSSNKPTKANISLSETTTSREMVSIDPHYPGLLPKSHAGQVGCMAEGCHQGSIHKSTSHPTGNVDWNRGKVNKPLKLPLAENAEMTCSTCHESHGGNFMKILRTSEKELCASCHKD